MTVHCFQPQMSINKIKAIQAYFLSLLVTERGLRADEKLIHRTCFHIFATDVRTKDLKILPVVLSHKHAVRQSCVSENDKTV